MNKSKALGRAKIENRYLFFKISSVNLAIPILDFDSVVFYNIKKEKKASKVFLYRDNEYKIKDLAKYLDIKVDHISKYGIIRKKKLVLIYSVVDVGNISGKMEFHKNITEKAIYRNYVYFKNETYLEINKKIL